MKHLFVCFGLFISFTINAQFPPPAGVPGTTAMHKDSSAFVAWATGCSVVRGYQDISDPSLGFASTGDSSMALGKAATNAVVSLGDGGVAVLTFASSIKNEPGWDFAVFENGLAAFSELAFVEVSSDGTNYFRFPATSNTQPFTQLGTFGSVDATKIDNLAGKYMANYGTPFDLSNLQSKVGLDVNNVTHVKVIDVVGCIQNAYATYDTAGNKINDPWPTAFISGGFDLDAIGVIHQQVSTNIIENQNAITSVSVYPNPIQTNSQISYYLKERSSVRINISDIAGRSMKIIDSGVEQEGWNSLPVDMGDLNSGIYLLHIETNKESVTKKIIYNK